MLHALLHRLCKHARTTVSEYDDWGDGKVILGPAVDGPTGSCRHRPSLKKTGARPCGSPECGAQASRREDMAVGPKMRKFTLGTILADF